jgi:hypothetical protein
MGGVLVLLVLVSLVAVYASLLEMLVRLDDLAVDEEGQVERLRLDRRRRPRSPFPLTLREDEGLAGFFQHLLVGVTGDTTACVLGGRRRGKNEGKGKKKRSDQGDEPGLHKSSILVRGRNSNDAKYFNGTRKIVNSFYTAVRE